MSPIFGAVIGNHISIVNFLCESKANLDERDVVFRCLHILPFVWSHFCFASQFGSTPLIFAAESGYLEVVQILCEARADVGIKHSSSVRESPLASSSLFIQQKKQDKCLLSGTRRPRLGGSQWTCHSCRLSLWYLLLQARGNLFCGPISAFQNLSKPEESLARRVPRRLPSSWLGSFFTNHCSNRLKKIVRLIFRHF